jgi:hypothetical protein
MQERGVVELQDIVEDIRRHFQLGILVYEPNEDESTSLDHHADMVIDLASRPIERPLAYLIHELCIRKARYQDAALGQHQFKIRGSGIEVFPSLHFQVHHYNYMDLELKRSTGEGWKPAPSAGDTEGECGTGSLIDLIFSPKNGESLVLFGPRNSFKTQLCLDFLSRGCWGCPKKPDKTKPENGLLISLIDNAPDIQRGLSCPWKKSRLGNCEGLCPDEESALIDHARAFCQRPGCITPAEFFHYVMERIENGPAGNLKRLAFWDLTQMDYRFPLFMEDKMLLPALMDKFKTKGLKSLFMGAGNAANTKAASAMADHVLFCWRSPRTPTKRPKPYSENPKISTIPGESDSSASLMLYVDRASASSQQSGKALFRIPISSEDKLLIPVCLTDLRKKHRLDPSIFGPKTYDGEIIKRITEMQGVA